MPTVPSNLQAGDLKQAIGKFVQLISRVINGQLSFGRSRIGVDTIGPSTKDNINGQWVDVVTPGVANTDFNVVHNLGYAATGYLLMSKGAAVDVYNSPAYVGTAPAALTAIILRATVPGVDIRFFVF